MTKISFKFRTIPDEFLTDDFLEDPDMMKFIRWILRRINHSSSIVPLKRIGKSLKLEPYEFMFGREKCSQECGISTKKVEGRLNQLKGLGFLEKVGSKSGSTFSIYRLVTERFEQIDGQHVGIQVGQQVGQQVGHNQDLKKLRSKKDHHPSPSSFSQPQSKSDGLMTDDFSSNINLNIQEVAKIQKIQEMQEISKTQLTQIQEIQKAEKPNKISKLQPSPSFEPSRQHNMHYQTLHCSYLLTH